MILVINCGSSSVKYQLFRMADETSVAEGLCDRVGINSGANATLKHKTARGVYEQALAMPDYETALHYVLSALTDEKHGVIESLSAIRAVGHRVVHGGAEITQSVLIDERVLELIRAMAKLAPVHNPANLSGIEACRKLLPHIPHVAVFDTAFHQTMPPPAYLYGLPFELYKEHNIRRYGFHGTSHRYVAMIASQMLTQQGVPPAEQKIITCHLGNGCSMAAIQSGRVLDTSMGLTPLEGLLMGTRCGDLDPAIVIYLAEKLGFTPAQLDQYLNKQSGLLGVSGVSSDMRDVRAAAATGNLRAQYAIDIFCYRVRKYIGAYAAVLGGLHAVAFTAGIGENEAYIRARCVEGLSFLGIELDPEKNEAPKPQDVAGWEIGRAEAPVRLFVIPTNEELMIARDTIAILSRTQAQ